MSATEPYQVTANLTFPPDDGAEQVTLSAALSGNFSNKASFKLELTGTGSHAVGFGSVGVPGAKAILVEYQSTVPAQQPIQLKFNSSTVPLEVAPGGFLAYGSPVPVAGITGLVIDHTTAATVRVTILG